MSNQGIIYCTKCGTPNPPNSSFCMKCGNKLTILRNDSTNTKADFQENEESDISGKKNDSNAHPLKVDLTDASFVGVGVEKSESDKQGKGHGLKRNLKRRWFIAIGAILVMTLASVPIILKLTEYFDRISNYESTPQRVSTSESVSTKSNQTNLNAPLFDRTQGTAFTNRYRTYSSDAIYWVGNKDQDIMFFTASGTAIGFVKYSEDLESSLCFSGDRSCAAFINNGRLKYVRKDGIKDLGWNVDEFWMSMEGDYLLFHDKEYLYYWKISTGEYRTFVDFDESFQITSMSPDGKAFTGCYWDDGFIYSYSCKYGEDASYLGERLMPVAISNGGEYIYYIKLDTIHDLMGTLYVYDGIHEIRLASDFQAGFSAYSSNFLLNEDGTQILFTSGGRTYLSDRGSPAQEVFPHNLYFMETPDGCPSCYRYSGGAISLSSNLLNQCYLTNGGVYFVNENGTPYSIVSIEEPASEYIPNPFRLSADGTEAVYLEGGALKYVNLCTGEIITRTAPADIDDFQVCAGLSAVYYRNKDGEIYYQKDTEEPIRIMEQTSYSYGLMSDNGTTYYIQTNDSFHIFQDGVEIPRPLPNPRMEQIDGQIFFIQPITSSISHLFIDTSSSIEMVFSNINNLALTWMEMYDNTRE